MAARGLIMAQRSDGVLPDTKTAVYIADTMGEMGLLYRAVQVVFVGGSLVRHGGQNPVEPAKLGAAVLHGPHVHNFVEAYAAIDDAGGALIVPDGAALATETARLLTDQSAARAVSAAAARAVAALSGALERTMAALEPTLARLVQ